MFLSFKKFVSYTTEFLLTGSLVFLAVIVGLSLYLIPSEYLIFVTVPAVFLLLATLFWIMVLALLHRLQFKMGFRNLIRHKSDTIIAILGFMVGTSIICSSMAIGDTMTAMIEDLVYEEFHLVDEFMVINNADGEPMDINGSLANDISSIVWDLEDEGLVDGVSWEFTQRCSIIDPETMLFEPAVTCRAIDSATYDSFGPLLSDGSRLDYDLGSHEIFMSEVLAEDLESDVGSTVTLTAGNISGNFTVAALVDDDGRGGGISGGGIFMTFGSVWKLATIGEDLREPDEGMRDWSGGVYNELYISNEGGVVEGAKHCGEVIDRLEEDLNDLQHPLGPMGEYEISGDKDTNVEQSKSSMEMFTTLFLVLGTFTIIAGITLIINIFVMLSEERKEEMGISRAVGMRRKDLRLTYLFEGTFYSILSSLVGVLLGIGSGWAMIWGMQNIFDSLGAGGLDLLGNYTVTSLSLILSFIAGFTITIATTLLVTRRVAKLNIVSAIRNTPVPKKKPYMVTLSQKVCGVYNVRTCSGDDSPLSRALEYLFNRMTLLGFASIVIGVPLLFAGISTEHFAPTSLGVSLILIGLALVIKYFLSERITYTVAGLLVLLFWTVPLPVFDDYAGGLEMFILSGIFMVTSAVMILIWNTDIILWTLDKTFSLLRASPAAIKMAISYPMKKRFRTGVTIFMFALIIFTITGMSMIVHIMSINIEGWETSLGGGYNVIGVSNFGIEDLESTVIEEQQGISMDVEVHDKINWGNTMSLSIGIMRINVSTSFQGMMMHSEIPYQCAGFGDSFLEKNTYGFSSVDWDLVYQGGEGDEDPEDVWEAVKRDPDLVVFDGSLGGASMFGPAGTGGAFETGDVVELLAADGTTHNKTIVAFTEQVGITAAFMYQTTAESQFDVTEEKVHLISVKEGYSDQDVANDIKRVLLKYGMTTIIISDIVNEILESQNAFFNLFNAFLSLGLVIGIIGLSIVTLRSVYERRHEIGMMRAIGFKRSAVVGSFMGESAFIAGSGLVLGTILGIILGWMLWLDSFGETMKLFGVPWLKILGIVALAFAVAVLSSIPPSLKAARVSPAESLRYD